MTPARRAVPLAAFLLSILAAPAHAENLLPNGGFDTGVAPWFERSLPPTWVADDAEGSPDSGSVRVIHDRASNVGPVGVDGVRSPCLPIEPGPHTAFGDYRIPTGQPVTGDTSLAFWWYANPDCASPVLSAINVARFDSEDSTGAWVRRSGTVVAPEGATHFYAALSIVRDQPGALTAYYDNVALCPEGTACSNSPDGWITDAEYPDFRFRVEITPAGGAPIQGVKEASCQPEVVCVSGALPGRSEVFLRLIGPRPNGFFWPTIVRFTPSRVDVEIEQLSTGQSRLYTLDAVPPGTETDLSGLQDREGFVP